MKTAIKLIALSLVLVMSVMMFASCGAISGTYENEILGTKTTYEFSGNKVKTTVTIAGISTTKEGTYEIKDDKITFTYEGTSASVPFEKGDDYIEIGGVKYEKK